MVDGLMLGFIHVLSMFHVSRSAFLVVASFYHMYSSEWF